MKIAPFLTPADFAPADLDWTAIDRQRGKPPAKRQRSGRKVAGRTVAGASLVAALVGAQAAENAVANLDDDQSGFGWLLRHARICSGQFAAGGVDAVDASDAAGLTGDPYANHPAALSSAVGFDGLEAGGGAGAEFPFAADDGALARHAFGNFGTGAGHSLTPFGNRGHAPIDHEAPGAAGGGPINAGPGSHGVQQSGGGGASGGPIVGHGGGHGGGHGAGQSGGLPGGAAGPGMGAGAGGVAPQPLDASMQADMDAILNLVPASGATHVAVNNGSWFDPATWANGAVPGDGARVHIPAGVSVAYDGESPASILTVRIDGRLDFATGADTFLEVDTLVVTAEGALTIGTQGDPVAAGVSAVIQIADNGPINVAWDPRLLSRGVLSFGEIEFNGAQKDTFLKVANDPLKGDTTLTLEAPPEGWQVGDRLVLTGTHLVATKGTPQGQPITVETEDEELIITSIDGNVITFDRPLQYDHEGARADLKAYVANYSRNVVIETENADLLPVHQRGHVFLADSNDVTVRYAEFSALGRTDKSERSLNIGDVNSVEPDTNIKGRYPLHIHRAGVDDQASPVIIEGASVWGSPGWGFVQHDSNAIFSNNAAYDVFGAAFVAETGNETGRWVDNIAIKSLGVDQILKGGGDIAAFDLGRTGTGFWFQGRLVEAVGNVAAGVPSGAGFTYFHRGPEANLLPVDASTAAQADALRYLGSVDANIPSISLFSGNESFATETGLVVVKANPRQGHDVRSVIDGFTAWEVETGVHLQYTGHYTIAGLDIVATDQPGRRQFDTTGVLLDSNVIDVVINGATIDGFYIGVDQAKNAKNTLSFLNSTGEFDYVYIDVAVTGATVDFTNRTRNDVFLDGDDLVAGRLDYQSAFAATLIERKDGNYLLEGVITDSIGQRDANPDWDPNSINASELRGAIAANGIWTTADGRSVTLIEEYFADRATGVLEKVGLFVEIPDRFRFPAGVSVADNGVLDLSSRAPIAVDDAASVRAGAALTIDVLSNDSDPDGDKITLDGLFSDFGRVVANDDGTVTYFADAGFSGDDVFYYFVQDTNGDITKAQVTVTVDI